MTECKSLALATSSRREEWLNLLAPRSALHHVSLYTPQVDGHRVNSDFENAIDGLYMIFAGYSVPAEVQMSDRRDPEEELGALRRLPLQSVPADGIDNYAEHALTTVSDVNLLKYALPRLLELTACEALMTDAETVLSKLELGGWRSWPEAERLAILAFLQAWWAWLLESEVRPTEWRALTTLCSVAQTNLSLAWFLHLWEQLGSVTAMHHLAHFVDDLFDAESGTLRIVHFWNNRPGQVAQVRIWLERRETFDRLKEGLRTVMEQQDEELVEVYQRAIAGLRVVLGESLR